MSSILQMLGLTTLSESETEQKRLTDIHALELGDEKLKHAQSVDKIKKPKSVFKTPDEEKKAVDEYEKNKTNYMEKYLKYKKKYNELKNKLRTGTR